MAGYAVWLAIVADAEADYQYGRPLDYNDPTGDRATWNALVTSTIEILKDLAMATNQSATKRPTEAADPR